MNKWEYSEVADDLMEVRTKIAEWRDDEDFFDGDRGYQRLLEREGELLERLRECA